MSYVQLKVRGEAVRHGAWFVGTPESEVFLHFGLYESSEAENIAHNLILVFGVQVQLVNTETKKITEYRVGE